MKIVTIVLSIVLAAALTIGGRWYVYVSNSTSPYDEVGIALNSQMPGPLNQWGCGKLRATFGAVLPPHGCQSEADPRRWR